MLQLSTLLAFAGLMKADRTFLAALLAGRSHSDEQAVRHINGHALARQSARRSHTVCNTCRRL